MPGEAPKQIAESTQQLYFWPKSPPAIVRKKKKSKITNKLLTDSYVEYKHK